MHIIVLYTLHMLFSKWGPRDVTWGAAEQFAMDEVESRFLKCIPMYKMKLINSSSYSLCPIKSLERSYKAPFVLGQKTHVWGSNVYMYLFIENKDVFPRINETSGLKKKVEYLI